MRARKKEVQVQPPPPEPIQLTEVESVESLYGLYRGMSDVCWRYHRHGPYFEALVACQCFVCGTWWGWTKEDRLEELKALLDQGCSKCNEGDGFLESSLVQSGEHEFDEDGEAEGSMVFGK